MPGPKMGPRPRDFDEELVRRSPTFRKWEGMSPGGKLRYACREFVKGQGDDEERLMRRIMIARRNNVRDHQALKWARVMQTQSSTATTVSKDAAKAKATASSVTVAANKPPPSSFSQPRIGSEEIGMKLKKNKGVVNIEHNKIISSISSNRSETEAIISRVSQLRPGGQQPPPTGRRPRRPTTLISDEAIKEEMDDDAVESTRSYKTWLSLPNGAVFLYNQKYIKGNEAHDWLLKKNIWRRMRYRRENKKMVEDMLSREQAQPASIITQQQQSKKRRHDATVSSNIAAATTVTTVGSSSANPAAGSLDRIMVNAASLTMAANASTTTPGVLNEINRQDVALASTASEIVDHALLSTNTAPASIPAGNMIVNAATVTISVGDRQRQQQQQQLQDQSSSAHTALHHHHHHDATGSAEAFAASIAMAGVGIGIGVDGDLNSHHETTVADSAAVEAAVAAALAATDVKSNSYHHHHLSAPIVDVVNNHHAGVLMDTINQVVVHGSNDPHSMVAPTTAEGRELHSQSVQPPSTNAEVSTMIAHMPTEAAMSTTNTNTTTNTMHAAQNQDGAVTGLGLALDAAAKLAAAASVSTHEAVLEATKAISAAVTASGEDSNDANDASSEAAEAFISI